MPLFDAIGHVQQFVDIFASVYALVLVLYVLLSWVPRLPSSLGPVQRFLHDVCEPYLRLWRRALQAPSSVSSCCRGQPSVTAQVRMSAWVGGTCPPTGWSRSRLVGNA